jgi:hypothetical protein
LKSAAFSTEKEWRAVFHVSDIRALKFRARRDHIALHIDADLTVPIAITQPQLDWLKSNRIVSQDMQVGDESLKLLPISDVIVGPSSRELLTFRALRKLFWQKGYLNSKFYFSDVPYRVML